MSDHKSDKIFLHIKTFYRHTGRVGLHLCICYKMLENIILSYFLTDCFLPLTTGYAGIWGIHLEGKSPGETKKTNKKLTERFKSYWKTNSVILQGLTPLVCFTLSFCVSMTLQKCFILIRCTDIMACQLWLLLSVSLGLVPYDEYEIDKEKNVKQHVRH